MSAEILLLLIGLPVVSAALIALLPKRSWGLPETLTFLTVAATALISSLIFKSNFLFVLPWLGAGIDFSLRLYHFSAFIILAANIFAFLIGSYSLSFLRGKGYSKAFYGFFLLTVAFVNGAVLANNLIIFLFFWEGLLLSLFGLIYIGGVASYKTAIKAFIINGIADLCLLVGIGLTAYLAGSLNLSTIHLTLTPLSSIAFLLLTIGTLAKAGSMPFHSWIPDAALDAPLPFMAFLPGAIEKLIGIYFLTVISFQLFALAPESWLSYLLMIIGALTIILAVMMALIQKDYKKLLSYHAISQVGYMVLGIGTAVPAGMVGGLFHMINNAMYKSALFLTGGAVEKQTGTTNLEQLGGLARKMPWTFICFTITALSISGVPPFNGFFSKELVYDGALERGLIFYLAAVTGSFFTAASFLKLGSAAYLGKLANRHQQVREAPFSMLLPIILIAGGCLLFGLHNSLPLDHLIKPVFPQLAAWHQEPNLILIAMTILVLAAALLNHWLGVRVHGSNLQAVDHIHYAPGLHQIYDAAEQKRLDPYEWGMTLAGWLAQLAWRLDRAVDWLYNTLAAGLAAGFSRLISAAHDGNYVLYFYWALGGAIAVICCVYIF